MSRYDGLIIPRSYSEYINKTDAATLQQALQLSGVLSGAVAAGDNKAVKSSAVNNALANKVVTFSTKNGFVTYVSNTIRKSGKVIVINLYGYTTKEIEANTAFITNLPQPATDFHYLIKDTGELVVTTRGDLYCTKNIKAYVWLITEIVYIEA